MNTLTEQDAETGLSQERLGFGFFVSICAHVMLILGVGFTVVTEPEILSSMEITLAQFRSAQAPDDPDFLAQANQLGSGSEDEALAPLSPEQANFYADDIVKVSDPVEAQAASPPVTEDRVITTADSSDITAVQDVESESRDNTEVGESSEQQSVTDTVASLRAQVDLRRQEYARRPRRYTVTSASTRQDRDALYLDSWRKRIEAVGNLNYPDEASRLGIYGTLRLLVALNPDGTVNDIRILRSSGEQLLDDAAIRIVELSAPFDPFPPAMRADVDVLEIIRTWQFQRGNTFTSF